MRVRINGPQQLHGGVKAPRSKAYTHRALVASMLTKGTTTIRGALVSDDTVNTLDAIQELGTRVRESKNGMELQGVGAPSTPGIHLDCAESGATLRFLTAIAAAGTEKVSFITKTGLANRPIQPLLQALETLGASTNIQQSNHLLRVTVQGPLNGGATTITGEISSQFVSGLLLASPFARNNVTIDIEGSLESRPYIDLTLAILRKHGICVEEEEGRFHVPAPQEYKPTAHQVPGDFSSATYLIAASATAGESVTLTGIEGDYRLDPDSIILELLPRIGVKIEKTGEQLTVFKSHLRGFEFEAKDHPDLVPALEVLAAQAEGKTTITGVKRLQYKETDRLTTVPMELAKMGARITVEEDLITIQGIEHLAGEKLSSHHDHRIAMACVAAALAASGESVVEDAGVVSKSYPTFFSDIETLGAKFHVE